jgi:hypothetical protein
VPVYNIAVNLNFFHLKKPPFIIEMAENGILDYQGMNQAIYRGATSNIVVDTQSMSIEIGAGNSSHTSNLHIECDHAANVASIQLNSNVVTEFSRSKKLIKYPRVALTANSSGGYVASASSVYNSGHANQEWEAFDNVIDPDGSGADSWDSLSNAFGNSGTPRTPTGNAATFDGEAGEWLNIRLPEKIVLYEYEHITRANRTHEGPHTGFLYGSNDGFTTYDKIHTFSGITLTARASYLHTVNATKAYNEYRLHVTRVQGSPYLNISNFKLFGIPEYDPEAHGTDVTVKSYPNVPNTDWLEVYYDAKDLDDGAVTTVTDLSPNTNNGTVSGDPQVSNGAFVFDGVDDYIQTGVISEMSGDKVVSYSVWIKADTLVNTMIVSLGQSGMYTTSQTGGIYMDSIGTLYNTVFGNGIQVSGAITTDTWIHIVATKIPGGSGTSTQTLYINGVKPSQSNWGTIGTPLSLSSPVIRLGASPSSNQHFNGSIANFRLFNRALTSGEIYQLYAYQKEYFGHGDLSMTLKAGRLGIGTSEPRAALDVRGTLKVNGPTTFTGRPNFTESLFFYTGNTPTNYYASTYKNRHGFYLNTLIPSNSHIGNYGTGGDNQVFTESSYGGGNELCGSHFDCMVYWLKNAPVGHVHRLNWCSNNGSGGSQTYGQKTSGTQIRLWGYWFHTGTYDRDWTGGVDFNISTSTVSVFYEGVTFQ